MRILARYFAVVFAVPLHRVFARWSSRRRSDYHNFQHRALRLGERSGIRGVVVRPAPLQQAYGTCTSLAEWFTLIVTSAWSTPIVATTRRTLKERGQLCPHDDAENSGRAASYFYAEDDGKIHAEENKPADGSSPLVK